MLEKIKSAAADPGMQELRTTIKDGFPNDRCNLSNAMRPFWPVRERLAIDDTDGMVVVGSRVIVPKTLRQDVLRDLLLIHQGATKFRQRARTSVYWPWNGILMAHDTETRHMWTHVLEIGPRQLRPLSPWTVSLKNFTFGPLLPPCVPADKSGSNQWLPFYSTPISYRSLS